MSYITELNEIPANIQPKYFCKCYNMLAWKEIYKTDDIHVNKKSYLCGRCQKGFSPADNITVHNLICTLTLPNTLNIFNKGAITKMHLTTYNTIHSNNEHCSVSKINNTDKSLASEDLAQYNKEPQCNGQIKTSLLTDDSKNVELSEDKLFPCILCNKSFKLESVLYAHHNAHVIEKLLYRCKLCDRIFRRAQLLKSHMLIHKNEIPYCCSLCRKIFSNKGSLSVHVRSHYFRNNKNSYTCKTCMNNFLSKIEVIKHLSTHIVKNPCDTCKKVYKLRNGFVFFYCVHYGKKRHFCVVCDKRFFRKDDLHLHLRVHCGKRPYKCNICKKAYAHRNSIYAHRARDHPRKNVFLPVTNTTETF